MSSLLLLAIGLLCLGAVQAAPWTDQHFPPHAWTFTHGEELNAADRKKAEEILTKFNRRFEELFNSGDAYTLAREAYGPESQFTMNDHFAIGTEAIEKHLKEAHEKHGNLRIIKQHWTMHKGEIVTMGRFVLEKDYHFKHGYYAQVLRLENDGKWRGIVKFNTMI